MPFGPVQHLLRDVTLQGSVARIDAHLLPIARLAAEGSVREIATNGLPTCMSFAQEPEGCTMTLKNVPIDTWMVVDVAYNGWNVISTHASQSDAERERDARNEGLARRRYSACMALEPIAERWAAHAVEILACSSDNTRDVSVIGRGSVTQTPRSTVGSNRQRPDSRVSA